MIKLILIITVLIFSELSAQEWVEVDYQMHPDIETNFYHGTFITNEKGWVFDYENGRVWKTIDSGKNFYIEFDSTGAQSSAISILDSLYLWLIRRGDSNELYFSNDAGENWEFIRADSLFYAIVPLDTNRVLLIGDEIFYTEDKGKTIKQKCTIHSDKIGSLSGFNFIDDKTGWAAIDEVAFPHSRIHLLKTTDGGLNWYYVSQAIGQACKWIHFNDSLTGTMGTATAIIETIDGGYTWHTAFGYGVNGNCFLDDLTGWAVASNYDNVFKTEDGGKSWEWVDVPVEGLVNLTSICFPQNGTIGYLFGTNNKIYKYQDFTSAKNEEVMDPIEFEFQNYPNPFNPLSTIEYTLPETNFVTIKVYNSIGQEVATLVNSLKQAGTHSVKFDGSNLASGVYFYRLIAEGFTETKKMILLK